MVKHNVLFLYARLKNMKPIITLQPPKAISLECTDPENPPWTEDMLGTPIIRFGNEAQKLPIKICATINLDADIWSWLKSQDVEYEILINNTLRRVMQETQRI
jgi:uncharacterized protein (DUF4415 family)